MNRTGRTHRTRGSRYSHTTKERQDSPHFQSLLRNRTIESRLDICPLPRNLTGMSEALQYLTDEHGKKTAVVLPITDYEKLLEDLDDLAAIAERREEPTIPHEQFKAELKRDGIL